MCDFHSYIILIVMEKKLNYFEGSANRQKLYEKRQLVVNYAIICFTFQIKYCIEITIDVSDMEGSTNKKHLCDIIYAIYFISILICQLIYKSLKF